MYKSVICAPAKMNLFLELRGKRIDGYHEIDTVMQTVSLTDEITLEKLDFGETELICPGLDIAVEDNLAYKAAALYLTEAAISDGWRITVDKHIPCGAGLGGGSADAAAVLFGLNEYYHRYDKTSLEKLASRLGSDVPFCVEGGCMSARGRGEILKSIKNMPDCGIVIVNGGTPVSTAAAYAEIDRIDYQPVENRMISALDTGDFDKICLAAYNRFGVTADYAAPIIDELKRLGAKAALLSGSGSAVFGVFQTHAQAQSAASDLQSKGCHAVFCKPLTKREFKK